MLDNPIDPSMSNSLTVLPSNMASVWKPILTSLVESKGTGIENEGQAMLVLLKAHELGIGMANAIPHIHTINGKSGIDIHIIKAILQKPKSGVTAVKTNDYKPIYKVILYTGIITDTESLPTNAIEVAKIKDNPNIDKLVEQGKVPYRLIPNEKNEIVPIDYITTYVFTRTKLDIKGNYFTETYTSSFKYTDAVKADVSWDAKSAWTKHLPTMMAHRAYTNGAREIASDLLMGNYSYDELLAINNLYPSEITEDGKITKIINKNGKEVTLNTNLNNV